jgi:hypothetical protein
MAERLIPCRECLRHVRCSELACPFCGAVVSTCPQPSSEPFRRLAAAAAVAAGVAALTATGCSTNTSGGSPPFAVGVDASVEPSGNAIACRTSAGCLPGQVCCGTDNVTSSCQVGPCPSTMFGQLQLCGISAECLAKGDTCGPLAQEQSLGVMVCNASVGGITDDGGIGEDGSSGAHDGGNAEGGSSRDADNGTDTGSSDAPTGG